MITFWEWLGRRRLIREGDEGYRAFVDQTNAEFRKMIGAILQIGKFTDPRNEAEAREIVSAPNYFNYAQELVGAARGRRARLQGQDVLGGAQDANVQLWMKLLNPKLYEPEGVTWESRNPFSAGRGGIRGTIRAWARNAAGHFAARINKRRTGVSTYQVSQIQDPENPFDSPARPTMHDLEWDDLKRAIINDLERQVQQEIESREAHWQSRARKLLWAVEIVKRQMVLPWTWRSMPEVADEIPGLAGGLRGGLPDQLKRIIDLSRRKALGEARIPVAEVLARAHQNPLCLSTSAR